ncbi:MAG: hypothetical protein DRO89_05620, partial [Candidatus Altiarchaeales archaeon]
MSILIYIFLKNMSSMICMFCNSWARESGKAILKAVFERELPSSFLQLALVRSGRSEGTQEQPFIGENQLREMPLARP